MFYKLVFSLGGHFFYFFLGFLENKGYICSGKQKKDAYAKDIRVFRFYLLFYSNEHEPIHVHVQHGGSESIFELIMMDGKLVEIRSREKKYVEPLSEKDKRTAEEFIRQYHKNIIEKWVKFFVLKQSVRSTSIKKKL